jgi:hypothetical protein
VGPLQAMHFHDSGSSTTSSVIGNGNGKSSSGVGRSRTTIHSISGVDLLLHSAMQFHSHGSTHAEVRSIEDWFPGTGYSTVELINSFTTEARSEMWLSPACLLLPSGELRSSLCEDDGSSSKHQRVRRHRQLDDLSNLEELLLSVYLFHFGTDHMFNLGKSADVPFLFQFHLMKNCYFN